MQRHGFGDPVHGEVTQNIAAVFAGLFYAAALEDDLGEFAGIEEFRAKQMLVAFLDLGINASDGNTDDHGRALGMFAVHFNRAVKSMEIAAHTADELMNGKGDL